jgi:hypothetical protein
MTDEEFKAIEERHGERRRWHGLELEEFSDIDALIAEVKRRRSLCGCLYDGLGNTAMFCAEHRPTWRVQKNLCAVHFDLTREGFHPGQKVPYCNDPKCQFIMPSPLGQ